MSSRLSTEDPREETHTPFRLTSPSSGLCDRGGILVREEVSEGVPYRVRPEPLPASLPPTSERWDLQLSPLFSDRLRVSPESRGVPLVPYSTHESSPGSYRALRRDRGRRSGQGYRGRKTLSLLGVDGDPPSFTIHCPSCSPFTPNLSSNPVTLDREGGL